MTDVAARLWGFCHTLRHDGIDYGDFIEQITYLLFIKMADEREIDSAVRGRLEQPSSEERYGAHRPLPSGTSHVGPRAGHARRYL